MLATFVVGSVLLYGGLFTLKARDDAAFVSSWSTMFNDCQLSIETRQPLSAFGLLPTSLSFDPRQTSYESRNRTWALLGGGQFAVLEQETDIGAVVSRTCRVIPTDWRKPLSRLQIERLTYTFLEQRSRLLFKGGYSVSDPLPPNTEMIILGFRLLSLNPVGCSVSTAVSADPENGDFTTIVGEHPGACGGPSIIKPPAAGGTAA